MSTDYGNHELFPLAVKLIRQGTGYIDLQKEIETAALSPIDIMDVRGLIGAARKFVETFQAESLEAAVGAAHRGMSHFEIAKRLRSLGFQSFDADTLAFRAIKTAEAEMAKESLTNGLSELAQETKSE